MLPTGTVTFLFTDLESSTRLWEAHPDAMPAALARHDTLLRQAVEAHSGAVVKTTGDGLHAAFSSTASAAAAAIAAQQVLQAEAWEDAGPLRVRMALHTGEAELRDGDYYGPALNRTARLMAAAHGGQILLSSATAALLRGEAHLLDLGEHRLRDLAAVEHVFQLDGPGLRSEFPPISSLATFAHNLPVQLTSFVGREREMAEVKRLLSATRLLTLTGPGGTGKTRLALQAAADLLDHFAGGAWLVELATLSDPALITQAVAGAIRVRDQPGRPLDEVVVDYLRDKRLLLLLDNCEHLVDACARLADHLLRACPHLIILVSSREALSIAGEVAFQVPSLPIPPVPEAGGPQAADSLLEYAAIRLFVERAQAARVDFRLTEASAPAVIQICRRLDGIPLAIELAAARVKVLPPEQIAGRLNDRFRLLTGGSRTALPRQQTLQALIDWSWDLLPEPERRLLRRLSVFAGGWTLEAAEAVAGVAAGDPEPLDVLEGLAQLVAKSLVVAGDEGRYHLLETIRQYARDRLWEAREGEAQRGRHADFFLALAREAEPHLTGRQMIFWLDRLDADVDNLRAALEWTLEGRPEMALQLAAALDMYWLRHSLVTEGYRWLEQVLDPGRLRRMPDVPAHRAAHARVLAALSQTSIAQGKYEAAVETATEGVALARRSGDSRVLAYTLGMLALAYGYVGRPDELSAAAQENFAISDQHGYLWEKLPALSALGESAVYGDRDLPRARGYLEEFEHLAQAQGNLWFVAVANMALGSLAHLEGETGTTQARFRQAVALFDEVGDHHFGTVVRSEVAHLLRRQGRLEEAMALYRQTLGRWQQLGHRAAMAHQLECLAMLALPQGGAAWAARLLGAAQALREATGSERMPEEQAEYEATLETLRGRLDESTLDAARAEGRAMPLDRAIAYALESQDAGR